MATAGLTQGWVAKRLPPRPPGAHKGTFGRLLVVAGSLEYSGAALLTGLGAIRAGVGLACLATPEAVGLRLLGLVPELTAMLLVEEAPGIYLFLINNNQIDILTVHNVWVSSNRCIVR